MSQINKYIYKRFGGEHLKKYNIYNLLHTNYDTFYDYLQKYTYTHNEYNEFLKISIDNIPLLRMNPAIYLYDLKYNSMMCERYDIISEILYITLRS